MRARARTTHTPTRTRKHSHAGTRAHTLLRAVGSVQRDFDWRSSQPVDRSPSHGVVPVRTRIRSAPKQLDGHTLLLFVADLLLCLIAVLLQPTLRRICRTNRYCVVTLMCTQTHGVCTLPRSDHSEWMRALRSFSLTRPTGRLCRLTRRQLGQLGALTRLGLR